MQGRRLSEAAIENISKYVDERLPEEYEKCLVGLNSILKEVWTMSQTENVKGDKIKALALAKECYAMKLAAIEKTDSDKMVVVNEKDRSHEKPQLSETTNSVF